MHNEAQRDLSEHGLSMPDADGYELVRWQGKPGPYNGRYTPSIESSH
jgi:hypothetical protein